MTDLSTLKAVFEEVRASHAAGWEDVLNTPFLKSRKLSELTGCDLWLKFENLQYTGAFKERGAFAKLSSLPKAERDKGVIAASAGNHAQGVAYHARNLQIKAVIVMPEMTPVVKVQQTEVLGAEVILHGETFDEANAHAQALQEERGLTFVHPFDDPHIMAGQGTIALEMLDAVKDLDILLAPIGGGGLLGGMALMAKTLNPDITCIGVQAELYPSMHNVVKGEHRNIGGYTLAEGIAVVEPGRLTREVVKQYVDDIVLVDERALERALSLYLNTQKTLAEGAGAAGLAAILTHGERFKGKKVGTVICGGNIDMRLLSSIIMRDLARSGRIARLRVELIDVPGQLVKVSTLISEAGGNVIDVAYHRMFSDLPAKVTYIDISVETHDKDHMDRVVNTLKENNMRVEYASY